LPATAKEKPQHGKVLVVGACVNILADAVKVTLGPQRLSLQGPAWESPSPVLY
jgi:hypothetical protein